LFLATLGRLTDTQRYLDLAWRSITTVRTQLARSAPVASGGMAGLPGIAYALCRLGSLLSDESLVDTAESVTRSLIDTSGSDTQYDIVSGSAGSIACLLTVHVMRPNGSASTVIGQAAEHLLATAQVLPSGLGWLPTALRESGLGVPPAGLSHGAAGIALALCQAAVILRDERYATAAHAAVEYERSLFDAARGWWRDVRFSTDTEPISAWCHGAVGIGLARLAIRSSVLGRSEGAYVDDEIAAALETTRRSGFGRSHSLCHGDLGGLDLVLSAAVGFGSSDLRAEADRWAAAILDSAKADGWICGVPFGLPTPSLLVGLSGIGYGLLRAAAPERVPSVLTLQGDVGQW